MKERWILKHRKGNFIEEGKRLNINPIILKLLYNKDIKDDKKIREYFLINRYKVFSYAGLPDIGRAADLLAGYIRESANHIRVIGDYDVDGVISTYILIKTIKELNPNVTVDYALPDRLIDGYGLNIRLIDDAKKDDVNLIITCDNGISAADQIAYAKSQGMEVIVTDHHEPPFHEETDGTRVYDTPQCITVDPKLERSKYPFSEICGAVVAFKLMCAVYEKSNRPAAELEQYVQYLSIATVCDVMPIIDENRDILKIGLPMLTNTDNIGLQALKKAQQVEDKDINTYILGFVIGPCINAAGRLETADKALELLLCSDPDKAETLADELKQLNDERKELTDSMVEKALKMSEKDEYKAQKVLVMYLYGCHESIAGIVAGKVREATGKPTLIFTYKEDELKGSGRSIDAYDMFFHLNEVRDLFIKMGGHKLAAGFSIKPENLEPLREELNKRCGLSDEDILPLVTIDMEIPFNHINMDLADCLKQLEPYGRENERPLFARRDVTISDTRLCGRENNVCQIKFMDKQNGTELKGILFDNTEEFVKLYEEKAPVDICFNIDINEWKDSVNVQLTVKHFRKTAKNP